MPRRYAPRRWFKTTEIATMRRLAENGWSQARVAVELDRDPGTVAQAALRYGIVFHAPSGRPVTVDPADRRRRRAEACRRYRARHGAKTKPTRVTRFDDPRVMTVEEAR